MKCQCLSIMGYCRNVALWKRTVDLIRIIWIKHSYESLQVVHEAKAKSNLLKMLRFSRVASSLCSP